jgi:hypothetical protein
MQIIIKINYLCCELSYLKFKKMRSLLLNLCGIYYDIRYAILKQ